MSTNSYDVVPYPDLSFGQTHPDRLCVIARLFGLDAPTADSCRVLELGCASGGNLLPMAYGLPNSHFVGVDLSVRQIEAAQQAAEALGLQNIRLEAMDIRDVDSNFGQFDYIIAHGVYSWVPPAIGEKLLMICEQLLAANGVGYISYNTYPGWHMVGVVREMMLYHTRNEQDILTRTAEAKDFLNFLADATPPDDSDIYARFTGGYHALLQKQHRFLSAKQDAVIIHDELSEVNRGVYFHEFMAEAERHGLQYLAESNLSQMFPDNFPPSIVEYLSQTVHSLIELEQYLDFLRNETFRQTLLCHQECALDRNIKAAHFAALYVECRAEVVSAEPNIHDRNVLQFRGADGLVFSTDHPVTKAALTYLAEAAPHSVKFDDLLAEARSHIYTTPEAARDNAAYDADVLAVSLFEAFILSTQIIDLHSYAPVLTDVIGQQPKASALARYQAQRGGNLTNLRHEQIEVDSGSLQRRLLPLVDGTRDRTALLKVLLDWAESGQVTVRDNDGKRLKDQDKLSRVLDLNLDAVLHWAARYSLLES